MFAGHRLELVYNSDPTNKMEEKEIKQEDINSSYTNIIPKDKMNFMEYQRFIEFLILSYCICHNTPEP